MDVYHKVLLNLYNVTGGRDSLTVDLKDLVKNQGFLGNYDDILQMLNGQGWIAETPKENYVQISHWGVKEAKKIGNDVISSDTQAAKQETTRLVSETKQFLIMLEEFARVASKENFNQMERKLNEIVTIIGEIKSTVG